MWVVKVNRSYNAHWFKLFTDETLLNAWIELYIEREKHEFSHPDVERWDDVNGFTITINSATVIEVERPEVDPLALESYD